MSPKGQVTVPKPVRDHLGLDTGSTVEFCVAENGEVILRKRFDTARPLREMFKTYALKCPAPSIEDLDKAIGPEVAHRDQQTRRADTDG